MEEKTIVLEENPELPKRPKKLLIVSIGFVVLIFFGVFSLFLTFNNRDAQTFISQSFQGDQITPTPIPFYEMTIPGLRARAYDSNIGNLDQVSSGTNYTSYLASYDSDGFKVNGLLTIPTGEKPIGGWPAIVFVHGYIPPTLYQTLSNYSEYVDYLARNGFVVFKIDLRGHADSEGEAAGGYYSEGYVVDVLNAKKALQNADFVDPEKIGFWGHSMAGNVVSRAMAASLDTPAVVIWAGAGYSYADLAKYGIDDNSYRPPVSQAPSRRRRDVLFETYGRFDAKNSFWKMVPMTNYLSDIKGAIQLNHAMDDTVVDIGYSRDLQALLDKTNIPHELHEYSSGGHNISGSSFAQAMQNTVSFFKKYL